MRSWFLLFSLLLSLAFTQGACDQIPEEGTIVYDVDYPRLNVGTEGSSSDGAGNTTTTNKFGVGYQVSESDGSSSVTESGAGDTLSIKLVKQPTADVKKNQNESDSEGFHSADEEEGSESSEYSQSSDYESSDYEDAGPGYISSAAGALGKLFSRG